MTTSKVNFVNIPQELKNNASFCVWKMEKRQGKPTKVPYNPKTGALARTNDPSTFSDFGTAMKTYALGGWDGIGYRVSEGIGAIDIDHCIREDGSLNDVAGILNGLPPVLACAVSSASHRILPMTRLCTTSTTGSTVWRFTCLVPQTVS